MGVLNQFESRKGLHFTNEGLRPSDLSTYLVNVWDGIRTKLITRNAGVLNWHPSMWGVFRFLVRLGVVLPLNRSSRNALIFIVIVQNLWVHGSVVLVLIKQNLFLFIILRILIRPISLGSWGYESHRVLCLVNGLTLLIPFYSLFDFH